MNCHEKYYIKGEGKTQNAFSVSQGDVPDASISFALCGKRLEPEGKWH